MVSLMRWSYSNSSDDAELNTRLEETNKIPYSSSLKRMIRKSQGNKVKVEFSDGN